MVSDCPLATHVSQASISPENSPPTILLTLLRCLALSATPTVLLPCNQWPRESALGTLTVWSLRMEALGDPSHDAVTMMGDAQGMHEIGAL